MTVVELELQVLKARVERLEARLDELLEHQPNGTAQLEPEDPLDQVQLNALLDRPEVEGAEPTTAVDEPLKPDDLVARLKAIGHVVDLPPEMHIYAERWHTLSQEEKEAVRWELDHLPPGPMASDIIIKNRRPTWLFTT